jgi:hypothetical protein
MDIELSSDSHGISSRFPQGFPHPYPQLGLILTCYQVFPRFFHNDGANTRFVDNVGIPLDAYPKPIPWFSGGIAPAYTHPYPQR